MSTRPRSRKGKISNRCWRIAANDGFHPVRPRPDRQIFESRRFGSLAQERHLRTVLIPVTVDGVAAAECRSTFVPGCRSQIVPLGSAKFDKVKLHFQHIDNRFEMPQMEAVGDVVQFHALVAALVQVLTDFSMKLLANLDRACAERTLAAH
jgi:hypothetical protein